MKFFSYVLVAVAAAVFALFVVNTDDFSKENIDLSSQSAIVDTQTPTAYTTYYDQLSNSQKAMYKAMEKAVAKADGKFTVSNVNIDEFKSSMEQVFKALQYDHPEYFWYAGGYSASYDMYKDLTAVTIEPAYYEYVSGMFDYNGKQKKLDKRVKEVADLARQHSSDTFEQVVFVHDYLIENAIYDHDGLNEYYKATGSPSCEYIFSAYGCLVNGKTVCSGYAKAFQLIMLELGYDCTYVVGDAGEAHGWNCLYLDGEGYFVDVTWDDYDYEKEIPMYNYALITSEALSRTHSIEMPFEIPVCTATEYNYFIRNGYYLNEYDETAVAEILSKQKDKKAAHIQFALPSAWGKALTELPQHSVYSKIDGMEKAYYIIQNEDHRTVSMLLNN